MKSTHLAFASGLLAGVALSAVTAAVAIQLQESAPAPLLAPAPAAPEAVFIGCPPRQLCASPF